MRGILSFVLIATFATLGCTHQVEYADLRSPAPGAQCRLVKAEPDDRWWYVAWDCGPEVRVVGSAHFFDEKCDEGDWALQLRNELHEQPSLGEARPLADKPGNVAFNQFCLSSSELAELVQSPVHVPR